MNWNFDEKHLKIAKVLVDMAKEEHIIYYADLRMKVDMAENEMRKMWDYLGDLSSFCDYYGMPLISAMVISNEDEQYEEFKKEWQFIKGYSDWDRLIELIKEEIYISSKQISRIKKNRTPLLDRLNQKVELNNVQDFISKLPNQTMKKSCNLFYRGQSNINYKLEPSVFRGNAKGKEDKIYLKVLTECSNEFDTNMTHIDIISKMQHYGVYTRLLDVTTNALVSLYFACEGENNKYKDGCVYIFNPDEKNIKPFDSDTISILSSLPRFNEYDKRQLHLYAELCKDNIKLFNEHDVVKRLLHEVKKEKPAFENIINPKDLLNNYFLLPKKDNPRIIRQSGAFIIYGLDEEQVIEPYKKVIIPSSSKDTILKQLKGFGISKATLHPELYKVAEYIKDSIDNDVYFL